MLGELKWCKWGSRSRCWNTPPCSPPCSPDSPPPNTPLLSLLAPAGLTRTPLPVAKATPHQPSLILSSFPSSSPPPSPPPSTTNTHTHTSQTTATTNYLQSQCSPHPSAASSPGNERKIWSKGCVGKQWGVRMGVRICVLVSGVCGERWKGRKGIEVSMYYTLFSLPLPYYLLLYPIDYSAHSDGCTHWCNGWMWSGQCSLVLFLETDERNL